MVETTARELEWSDLAVILAVCRAGTLSGAARTLGQNHSTVFRRLNAIEEKTGVRFFERLSDGYAMTEAGETALRYAERIESEVHALSREVLGQDRQLRGKIRVASPDGISMNFVPRLAAKFRQLHPEVSIESVGGISNVDLSRREADVAIRATTKPPDASLGRKVCDFRFAIYSSPQYLRANRSKELQDQSWCLIGGTVDWLVPLIWKKKVQAEAQIVFSSSPSLAVVNATAQGMGFTLMPCYLGDSDSRLVRVGQPLESLLLELWVLTHPDLRHTARVKALIAFLFDELKKDEDLFAGHRPKKK